MVKHFDFLKFAKSRHTTYEFTPKNISDRNVNKILEAAIWAPNVGNIQPWHFVVIKQRKRIEQLLDSTSFIHFPFITPSPNVVVAFVLDKRVVENGPFKKEVIPVKMEDSKMCIGMAALQATLQAESMGISSCILTPDEKEAREFLKVHGHHQPLLFVGFGYPKKNGYQKVRVRKPLKDVVSYEHYRNSHESKGK